MKYAIAPKPIRYLSLCTLAAIAISGCSGASAKADDAANVASSAVPAAVASAPAPTAENAHLNVVPIVYPSAPLPPSTAPISFDVAPSPVIREVHAGDVVKTPCYQTIASLDGVATISGCRLDLATQTLGRGTAADVPYFTAAGVASALPNVDALMQENLSQIASANAQNAAGGHATKERIAQGPYAVDIAGPYLGSRHVRLFGLDAREMTWGYWQDGEGREKLQVFAMLPDGRYVSGGQPLTAIMAFGWKFGYESRSFAAALANMRMR
jgi:hypothetical protein